MLVEIMGKKNEEFTGVSSVDVAESFGKRHDKLLFEIERMYSDYIVSDDKKVGAQNGGAKLFYKTTYENRGKQYPQYVMNRDGFSLLVMGFTGSDALQWKIKYINAFNSLEAELKRLYDERKQWEIERAKGMLVRHILTDTIKMKVADSPHKRFMYPNYTKLIYKAIFGKTFQELQAQYGVKGKESIRGYVTEDELREIESMEMLVSSLINVGWGYEQIKSFVQVNCLKQIA